MYIRKLKIFPIFLKLLCVDATTDCQERELVIQMLYE